MVFRERPGVEIFFANDREAVDLMIIGTSSTTHFRGFGPGIEMSNQNPFSQ